MEEYDIIWRGYENLATVESAQGDKCLYNSINYLRAPASYDFPTTDDPFNVDQYNCNVG